MVNSPASNSRCLRCQRVADIVDKRDLLAQPMRVGTPRETPRPPGSPTARRARRGGSWRRDRFISAHRPCRLLRAAGARPDSPPARGRSGSCPATMRTPRPPATADRRRRWRARSRSAQSAAPHADDHRQPRQSRAASAPPESAPPVPRTPASRSANSPPHVPRASDGSRANCSAPRRAPSAISAPSSAAGSSRAQPRTARPARAERAARRVRRARTP